MKTQITILVILVAAMVTAAPLGTEFTYQGVLSDAGAPAAGIFDFQFYLYDAAGGGSQVGPLVVIEDVTVTDGRFTTQLDFGSIFDGTALWLEVGVRDGGLPGTFTVLSPRQELTAAPFAQHAQIADTADTAGHATTADSATTAGHATTAGAATTAGDSDLLDGMDGSYYLTWSNFVGIPTDIADGDDDILADLSCSGDEIARWNGSSWNCSADDDSPYVRTYVVGPVGTPSENGTALSTAVIALPQPSSKEEAVLLVLESGVYDLGSGHLDFSAWTAVAGSGVDQTLVTSAVCEFGTIQAAESHFGLRRLSVENTCAGTNGNAIRFEGDGAVVDHVRLSAIGAAGNNYAVYLTPSANNLRMANADVKAENGVTGNFALSSHGETVDLVNVTMEAIGGSGQAVAIQSFGDALSVGHSTLKASGSLDVNVAFRGYSGEYILDDVIAEAELGAGNTTGIELKDSYGVLNNVRVQGNTAIEVHSYLESGLTIRMRNVEAQGAIDAITCEASHPLILDIDDSWMLGGTGAGLVNVPGSPECTITIKGSYVMGTPAGVSGNATCIANWDDTSFYYSTCPGSGP